jgi:hypothetical protein
MKRNIGGKVNAAENIKNAPGKSSNVPLSIICIM